MDSQSWLPEAAVVGVGGHVPGWGSECSASPRHTQFLFGEEGAILHGLGILISQPGFAPQAPSSESMESQLPAREFLCSSFNRVSVSGVRGSLFPFADEETEAPRGQVTSLGGSPVSAGRRAPEVWLGYGRAAGESTLGNSPPASLHSLAGGESQTPAT